MSHYSLELRSLNALVAVCTHSEWIDAHATADELRGLFDVIAPLVEKAHADVNGPSEGGVATPLPGALARVLELPAADRALVAEFIRYASFVAFEPDSIRRSDDATLRRMLDRGDDRGNAARGGA